MGPVNGYGNTTRPRRLSDLAEGADDQPLTTRELAQMIGMSPTFVRAEIRAGNLRAASVGRGRKRVFRIPVREARNYAAKLGLM
jgi:hypothetical protein